MRSKLSLFAASAALALNASAAIDLGNGVKVVPNVTVSAEFNDNLFLASTNEQEETLSRISPGVLFAMGEGAVNSASFSYNEEFQFYSEESDLNTSLSLVDFKSRYDDGKMKIEVDAWWHEANQATRDAQAIGTLAKREILHGGVSDEVSFSDKSSGKLAITYENTEYKPAGYSDWQWVEVPVQYFYEVLPKLDASLGFRYRQNNIDGIGIDSDEYFYNVGLRGEFTAKLTGEIQVGYMDFQRDVGESDSTLGLVAAVHLAASAKTNLHLKANNSYGYSGSGSSYRIAGVTASFDTEISTQLRLSGSVFWNNYEYLSGIQNDDYIGGQLAGTYTFNEHAELTASYTYSDNDSNLNVSSFTSNVFSLSATLKY